MQINSIWHMDIHRISHHLPHTVLYPQDNALVITMGDLHKLEIVLNSLATNSCFRGRGVGPTLTSLCCRREAAMTVRLQMTLITILILMIFIIIGSIQTAHFIWLLSFTVIGCIGFECPYHGQCVPDANDRPTCVCPLVCSAIYNPVCGCNDKTYPNECMLHAEACKTNTNITIQHWGRCNDSKKMTITLITSTLN